MSEDLLKPESDTSEGAMSFLRRWLLPISSAAVFVLSLVVAQLGQIPPAIGQALPDKPKTVVATNADHLPAVMRATTASRRSPIATPSKAIAAASSSPPSSVTGKGEFRIVVGVVAPAARLHKGGQRDC